MENILKLKQQALTELEQAKDLKEVENLRVHYLGRKGKVTKVLKELKDLPIKERKVVGLAANQLKKDLEEAIGFRKKELVIEPSFLGVDPTRPGKKPMLGHLHPLTKIEKEIRQIFLSMNFSVIEGSEIETEYYNFDALNIPAFHPAREAWDTFWLKPPARRFARSDLQGKSDLGLKSRLLLRTHTSPMQVRYMETHEPPFQIVVPGRVFRYEATDATHETNFYQLEGLMVGRSVSLVNFKFIVEEFFKKFFGGRKIDFRFVPSYYPFVEPGLDVEIKFEKGESRRGTSSPRGEWLEVMGSGMVHPNVFEAAHYNPRDWQGFAFGIGIDRLMMIKYKVPNMRLSYAGDLRFIEQF